jgi:hypothetical protein
MIIFTNPLLKNTARLILKYKNIFVCAKARIRTTWVYFNSIYIKPCLKNYEILDAIS